jgi:hypothetical protein
MDELTNPCKQYADRIALMASGDVADPELADTMRHLSECRGCREYWSALQEDHRGLAVISRAHQERVLAVENSVIEAVTGKDERSEGARRWWRWIMETKTGRLLAGGTAAAAVFLFIFLQTTTAPFTAWAEVIEKARNASSCRFRAAKRGDRRVEAIKTFSQLGFTQQTLEDGEVVEEYYIDFAEGRMVHMILPYRRAFVAEVGDKMVQRFRERDPALIFEVLADIDHEDLGSRRIDGRKAVGIRARGRNIVPALMDEAEIEVWVDPDTKWPIRIDVDGYSADGEMTQKVRWDEFEWNVSVSEDDFWPDIPRRYETVTGIEMEMDEAHAIISLGEFADELGYYPSHLTYERFVAEMWGSIGKRVLSTDVLPLIHQVRATCSFYGSLVENDQDVLYFGDRIRPGDGDRVLMRWKTGDDEYRVIYGDLEVETIDGETLLRLESQ